MCILSVIKIPVQYLFTGKLPACRVKKLITIPYILPGYTWILPVRKNPGSIPCIPGNNLRGRVKKSVIILYILPGYTRILPGQKTRFFQVYRDFFVRELIH